MKFKFIFILFLLCSHASSAKPSKEQEDSSMQIIEELSNKLNNTFEDDQKAQLHYDIAFHQLNNTLEFDKALEHLSIALEISEQNKDTLSILRILQKIGFVKYSMGKKESSISYYNEALSLARAIEDHTTSLDICIYLGSLYEEDNNMDKALSYYKIILIDHKKNKSPSAKSLATIGRYHTIREEYEQAIDFNIRALALFSEENNDRWVSYIYSALSELSLKINKLDNALEFAKTGLFIAEQNDLIKEKKDNYDALWKVYEQRGEFEESQKYLKLFMELKDSTFSEKKIHNIEILEAQLDNQRNERKISLLKKEKELQASEIKSKKITLYASIAVAILILVFSIITYGRFKLIKNQKREIELKNTKLNHIYNQQKLLLKDKDTLLKEVHHRVKNNMQVINSLLVLQSNSIENKEVKEIFKVGQNRIYTMAMVHEMLYSKGDLSKIEFSKYAEELIDKLSETYSDNNSIEYHISVPTTAFDLDTAVPLGLLINEIITNSLKYAFPDNLAGIIYIELGEDDENYQLKIGDNGIGISEDDINKEGGLGHELIESLTEQIHGQLKMNKEKGTHYIITFPKTIIK